MRRERESEGERESREDLTGGERRKDLRRISSKLFIPESTFFFFYILSTLSWT